MADARRAARATGSSDEEWWAARAAALTELVPDFAERFPAVVRLEREGVGTRIRKTPKGKICPTPSGRRGRRSGVGLGVLLDGIDAARAGQGPATGHRAALRSGPPGAPKRWNTT
ncbi:hypothetical protein SMICM17S_04976 [Streptomyces microflavus]